MEGAQRGEKAGAIEGARAGAIAGANAGARCVVEAGLATSTTILATFGAAKAGRIAGTRAGKREGGEAGREAGEDTDYKPKKSQGVHVPQYADADVSFAVHASSNSIPFTVSSSFKRRDRQGNKSRLELWSEGGFV